LGGCGDFSSRKGHRLARTDRLSRLNKKKEETRVKIRLKLAFAALMLAVSIFLTHGAQAKQPLYCSFVLQKDITRFHCDVNQNMPAFHPRPDAREDRW
jgi:hypothetical protein